MMIIEIKCVMCDELATWMRYTQFAGNHPFCDKHAELEADFNDGDWEKIDHDISNNNEHNRSSLDS